MFAVALGAIFTGISGVLALVVLYFSGPTTVAGLEAAAEVLWVVLLAAFLVVAVGEWIFAVGAWMLKSWAWKLGMIMQAVAIGTMLLAILTGNTNVMENISMVLIAGLIVFYLSRSRVRQAFVKR